MGASGDGARRRRVVVTGLGCVTPLGADVASTWEAAVAGRSGAAPITHFDSSDFPVRFAARSTEELDLGDLPAKEARRLDRFVRLALAAAREAVGDAALDANTVDPERAGAAIMASLRHPAVPATCRCPAEREDERRAPNAL